MPKQLTGIPVQKITLSHAHKCVISDVIRHKLIFFVVTSSPGGSCMSHQVETIQECNASALPFFRAKSKIVLTGVSS